MSTNRTGSGAHSKFAFSLFLLLAGYSPSRSRVADAPESRVDARSFAANTADGVDPIESDATGELVATQTVELASTVATSAFAAMGMDARFSDEGHHEQQCDDDHGWNGGEHHHRRIRTISAAISIAAASPASNVIANGMATSTIIIMVRGANGNPVAGQTVQLASTGTNNTLTQPSAVTGADGVAIAKLTSTRAETKTLTATINPGPSQVIVAHQPTVTFCGDPGRISASLSSATAVPASNVAANGVALSTITVVVRDVNGNPVAGQTVKLASTGTSNTLTQPSAVTSAEGAAIGKLASTKAEMKTLTATINPGAGQVVVAQHPTVVFGSNPSTISATSSIATASPAIGVVANGVATSTITVTVKDTTGKAVSGQAVQLSSTGSNNTLTQPTAVTDVNGIATGRIASTRAETKTITATINPGASQVVVVQRPTVAFIGDPSTISAASSSSTASPSSDLVANGAATSFITVTVKDANGNLVAGQIVRLASTGTSNTLTQPPAVTDANGVATGAIASTKAETKTLTATINPGASQVVLAQQPAVAFIADPSTISAALSSATASPATNVVANGVATSAITVTVRDANGNAVAGQTVQLASTGANNTVTQPPAVTNASGVATGAIASMRAEMKTLTATINPGASQVVVAQHPTVAFVGDSSTISAAISTATAGPASNVLADGLALSAITVTVRDVNGNPVAGQTVQLASTGTSNLLTQPPAVTDASGVAMGAIASTKAETKALTATINAGASQVIVAQQPMVSFVADPSTISATSSSATASPASNVVADGLALSAITVTVKDSNGNPVAGQTVQLASTGTSNTLTQPLAVTDASGVAMGAIASTKAETKTLTAAINPGANQVVVVQQPTVIFVADPSTISATSSSATASPASNVVADGVALSAITVTVQDANGNPVAGQIVQLASTGTSNTLTQPLGVTDMSGVAMGAIASTKAETKTLTATINPGASQVVVAQQPTVAFVGDPSTINAALSTATASPSSNVIADGAAISTITVTVKDVHGNSVAGQSVRLASTSTSNTLMQPLAVTDANGVATGAIASTKAGTKSLTATINPGANQVVVAQQPTVGFVADASTISAAISTATAGIASDVVADGTASSMITVTVMDANENPVAGQIVQLASTGSSNTLTQPSAVTDASGVATGAIASTHAETKTLTATINPGASQVVVLQQPTVAFVGDASTISAANSTAMASPATSVVADGTAISMITVTVKDANDNPVSGQVVQLASTGTSNTLTQPLTVTDASGVATGAIASTKAEMKTFTATINPGAGQVVVAQQPTARFIADASTISATNSSATASSSSDVVANGIEVSSITVTVKDAHGNEVSGQTVQLASTGASNTLTQPLALTDASGVAIGTIASTKAETKTLTATINPGASQVIVAQQPTVAFVGDPSTIDATLSSATAGPASEVVANGLALSTITVAVKDVNGNAVAGQTVQLASTGTSNMLTQPTAVTGASGIATGTLASTKAETKTLTATINPGASQVVVAQQPTVGFIGDVSTISAANSTATASPSSNVVADGATTSTITVTVRDAHGNVLAGQTVQLASTGTSNTLTQPVSFTGAGGVATGTIASIHAETKTLTATINPGAAQVIVAQKPTAIFVGDPATVSAASSTVSASPSTFMVANGSDTSSITVTVRDVNANVVSGQTVTIAATGSANTVTQPASTTNVAGEATCGLASAAAQTKTITATINPGAGQVIVAQTATVQFIWSATNTYYVRQSGTDPVGCTGGTTPSTAWRTIGKAASCATAGSVVYVGAGVYDESVTMMTSGTSTAPIRFLADSTGVFTGDAGQVIVDGGGANQTLQISGASWIEIAGFAIRGGASASAPSGGIRLGDAACSNIRLHDNVIYDNAAGIYVRNASTVAIEHNSISNNADTIGDGIVVRASSGVTIRNNLIYANGRYGVLALEGSQTLMIESNTLYMNVNDQVATDGAANSVTIRNNIIAFGSSHGITLAAGSTGASSFNDLWSNSGGNWNGLASGAGDISLEPYLVDPNGADNLLGAPNESDDDFHLSVSPASPALDVGSVNATPVVLSDGSSLADRISRSDLVLDGTAPDGAQLNLGYHYAVAGAILPALEVGDTRLYYGEGAVRQMRLRTFDASVPSWSAEASAVPTGSTVRFVVSEVSPLDNGEEIVATLADGGTSTELEVLQSGTAWSRVFQSTAITSANSGKRGFDVAFESLSGDILVVYSNNTMTPVYRARSAGTWSAEAPLPLNDGVGPNPDPNTGIVHWIELASRPGSNEIALGYSDANNDLVVIVWNGTQWLTATAVALETTLTTFTPTTVVENRCFDLAYESLSGDLMVAWGRSTTSGFRFSVKAAGSSTFGISPNVTGAPLNPANFIALAAEPGTDRIALAAVRVVGGAFPERLGLATWTGSIWVNLGEYDSSGINLANTGQGDFPADIAWVGTTGVAVCVYPDATTATLDWARWTAASGWTVQSDIAMAGKSFTDSVQLLSSGAVNHVVMILSDATNALYAGNYDGTTWSLTATPLETSLSSVSARAFGAALGHP